MVEPHKIFNKDKALEYLLEQYGDSVKKLAYTYVKDWSLAEDIAQEVFLTSYRNWDSFRGECSYKTWLFKITVNKCKDTYKTKWFNVQHLFETLSFKLKSTSSTEQEVILKSESRELSEHVLQLPIKYREIIILFYYEELKIKEIQELTGLKVDTIKSRLKRGKEKLRQMYRGE
ncbi:sigma-70 family RNA polymerase sigma factor [Bacillus sp. 31A1R]|uniref:RNA polymerase sigma factor n=1 Tax=Robertmurraya mangrovi TaxID=3098077 RepID=A0ABU5J0Z0_9BACI|nr:sigma-70 family RNA polymerase sigma factor [Bacillus sp. 31A1R]MDZ5473067.1 sigma-70 family RNA polymerase sigma factor [Bacillus sp. 31A1R]